MTRRYFTVAEPLIEVCTYSFNRCTRPAGETCLVRGRLATATDAREYRHQANRAQNCQHLGQVLTEPQHRHRRIGVLA